MPKAVKDKSAYPRRRHRVRLFLSDEELPIFRAIWGTGKAAGDRIRRALLSMAPEGKTEMDDRQARHQAQIENDLQTIARAVSSAGGTITSRDAATILAQLVEISGNLRLCS